MCFFVCANIIPAFVYVQCGHLFVKCHTSIFYVLCGHLTRFSSASHCYPHWTHTLVTIFLSSHRPRYDLWFSCTSHTFLSESSIVVLISITNVSTVISRHMISTIWSSTSVMESSEFWTTCTAQISSSGYPQNLVIVNLAFTSVPMNLYAYYLRNNHKLKIHDVSPQSKQGLRQTHHLVGKQTAERDLPWQSQRMIFYN